MSLLGRDRWHNLSVRVGLMPPINGIIDSRRCPILKLNTGSRNIRH